MKKLLLLTLFCTGAIFAQAQVTISSNLIDDQDGWLHIKLTDTINQQTYFDSLVHVSADIGTYNQSFSLPSSVFKCEVLNFSLNMKLPVVKLNNGTIIPCDEELEQIIFSY
jgi:hypothetical protein